jgi:hypothetical protein
LRVAVRAVLGELDYRNLDEVAEFRGRNKDGVIGFGVTPASDEEIPE